MCIYSHENELAMSLMLFYFSMYNVLVKSFINNFAMGIVLKK